MAVRYKILIIGRSGLRRTWPLRCLTSAGHDCITAENVPQAISLMASHMPDMAVLIDDVDGVEMLTDALRSRSKMPIFVLGSGGGPEAASLLRAGADDYIRPGCTDTELTARVERALRRSQCQGLNVAAAYDGMYRVDELTVDFVNRQVLKNGKNAGLTPQEYRIVAMLAKKAGQLVSYSELLHGLWGENMTDGNQILRVNVANIRRKLENDPRRPQYILTHTGLGYRLRGSRD